MKKYNYTSGIHHKLQNCYVTDSFDRLPEAVSQFALKDRCVLIVAEKKYAGFYKESLTTILQPVCRNLDVFETESDPIAYEEEKEKLRAFASDIGFCDTDCMISLGGFPADLLAGSFLSESVPNALYLKLPVTFTAQLLAGKPAGYLLEADPALESACKAHPSLIYINIHAYKYLSLDERLSGMGEALRAAVSSDRALFQYIETNAGKKTENYSEFLLNLIMNCLQNGPDAKKNEPDASPAIFGYTIARGLEKCTNYIIPHGSAVGIGMVVANSIAARRNILSNDENFRIARLMVTYGLSVSMNFTNELIDAICAAVESEPDLVDGSGTIREFILAEKLGHTKSFFDVTMSEIREVMNYGKF